MQEVALVMMAGLRRDVAAAALPQVKRKGKRMSKDDYRKKELAAIAKIRKEVTKTLVGNGGRDYPSGKKVT